MATDEDEDEDADEDGDDDDDDADEDEDEDDDDGPPIGLDSQATPPSPSQESTPKTGPPYLTYTFSPLTESQ